MQPMETEAKIFWLGMAIGFVLGMVLTVSLIGIPARAQGVPGMLNNGEGVYLYRGADGQYSPINPLEKPLVLPRQYGYGKPC